MSGLPSYLRQLTLENRRQTALLATIAVALIAIAVALLYSMR